MLTVSISVNGEPIYARTVVNIGTREMTKQCRYKLDTGDELYHNPDDGAVALAIEMLKTIHEVGTSCADASAEPAFVPKEDITEDTGTTDPLFHRATEVVRKHKRVSPALLQEELNVYYVQSVRLIDQLEAAGVISAPDPITHRRKVV